MIKTGPLVNRNGDPEPGSPTKSTMRYRWHELRHWAVEVDARSYWDALPDDDKTQTVDVPPGYWNFIEHQMRSFSQPLTSEPTLKFPFNNALQIPHNTAIQGASDAHAEIWAEGSKLAIQPIGNADFIMVHDTRLTGIIELKTWWKVTATEIEDVRTGREPLDGIHHGRLAIEQAYGYLVFDKVRYGIMATFNSFVFLKRESPGILYMSNTIPIDITTPTILKLLYFFSHLCAADTAPHPEVNSEGNAIHLRTAPKTADKAPKIPDPNYIRPPRTLLPPADLGGTPRRSPRFQGSTGDSLRLDIANLTFLGCKGWRGTLNNGCTVFAKLWDGWKLPASYSEHEANVYYHLRDLWGTVVPDFIGLGDWGFCHILLLSYIESPMLYQVKYTPQIGRNVVKAFNEIHARGVCHGDIRGENILVRPDQSVVVIDFEMGEVETSRESLMSEMREVKQLLASFKSRASKS